MSAPRGSLELIARGHALFRALPIALTAACASGHGALSPTAPPTTTAPGTAPSGTPSGNASGTTTHMVSGLPGCPAGNGIRISLTSGTGTDSSSVLNTVVDERRSIDTTIVFNVALKSWTRTNLAAAISAGLADQARGGYAICAGVSALIPSATLTIKGARGRVHFAATLQDLLNSIRSGPGGTSPQLRRM